MLEWIPAFFEKATAWCPRFQKVPPTFRFVKWSNCGEGTVHGPGLVWYWPLVTETEDVDVRWQSTVTHVQSLTMADGCPVSARCLTVWRVDDALTAIGENTDYSDRAAEISQSCVVDVLGKASTEMLRDVMMLNMMVTVAIREELEPMGLEVEKSKFTELVAAPAFRIINDG